LLATESGQGRIHPTLKPLLLVPFRLAMPDKVDFSVHCQNSSSHAPFIDNGTMHTTIQTFVQPTPFPPEISVADHQPELTLLT
jgi:hypothetical protein